MLRSLGALAYATTEHATSECLDLAVVIPTYNERENIPRVLESLAKVLSGISYEAIAVAVCRGHRAGHQFGLELWRD